MIAWWACYAWCSPGARLVRLVLWCSSTWHLYTTLTVTTTPFGGYFTSAAVARNCRHRCSRHSEKPQLQPPQPVSALADTAIEQVASASESLNTSAAGVTPEGGVIRDSRPLVNLGRVRDIARPTVRRFIGHANSPSHFWPVHNAATNSRNCVHCEPLRSELSATLATCHAVYNECTINARWPIGYQRDTLTHTVLPWWQHLHSQMTAQCCAAAAHSPNNVRTCCLMAESLVAEREASVTSRCRERVACRCRHAARCRVCNTLTLWSVTRAPHYLSSRTLVSICSSYLFFFACISCALLGRSHAGQLILRIFVLSCLQFALPVRSRSSAPSWFIYSSLSFVVSQPLHSASTILRNLALK